MFKQTGKFLGGGVAKPIRDIAGIAVAPRDRQREMQHEIQMAVMRNFREYMSSEPTSWYGKLIKSANAAIRPTLSFGTIALFSYAFINPSGFSASMTSLAIVPIELWSLLGGVSAMVLGGRIQTKSLDHKAQALRLENLERTTELVLKTRERLLEKANETTGDQNV